MGLNCDLQFNFRMARYPGDTAKACQTHVDFGLFTIIFDGGHRGLEVN